MRARLNFATAGAVHGFYNSWKAVGSPWFYKFNHDASDDVFNIRRGPFNSEAEALADFKRYGSIEE